MSNKTHTILNRGSLILAGVWLVLVWQTLDPKVDDFERYWQAAVDLLQYGDPYVTRQDYFYPPFFVYLIQPFALLTHEQGQSLWFVLNVLVLGGFIALSIKLSGSHLAHRFWGIVVASMLIAPPTRISLQLGQVSMLVALLVAGCFTLAAKRAPLAGMLLAVASLIRLNPAFLGLAYLLRPPRRVAWWAAGSGVVLVMLSLLLYGPGPYQSYYQTIVHANIQQQGAYPYAAEHNISLFGFWFRLLATSSYAIPPIDAPMLARLLVVATGIGVLGVCLWVGHRQSPPTHALLTFGVWVCGMMLLWPTNGYYNLVILLLPLLAVMRFLEQHPDRTVRAWLIVATALVCIPPGWSSVTPTLYTTMHTGWWLILLTPSFYGLCLWMGLLAWLAQRSKQISPSLGGREGKEERTL